MPEALEIRPQGSFAPFDLEDAPKSALPNSQFTIQSAMMPFKTPSHGGVQPC
jgi:hypothetical protein